MCACLQKPPPSGKGKTHLKSPEKERTPIKAQIALSEKSLAVA
jgi:hypothetical protein